MSKRTSIPSKDHFKSRMIFVLFLICSSINVIGEGLYIDSLILFSKPLLLFLLFLFFFKNTRNTQFPVVTNWIIFALLASNLGDILLLMAGRNQGGTLFFLGGLGSFLMTHIAYALAFRKLSAGQSYSFPVVILLPMLVFWIGFNYTFSTALSGIMKPAVGLYSMVILIMVYFSWRLHTAISNTASQWVLWGALLFLISDTFVGFNKFGQDLITIPAIGVIIMSTYLAGQALIVLGLVRMLK